MKIININDVPHQTEKLVRFYRIEEDNKIGGTGATVTRRGISVEFVPGIVGKAMWNAESDRERAFALLLDALRRGDNYISVGNNRPVFSTNDLIYGPAEQ